MEYFVVWYAICLQMSMEKLSHKNLTQQTLYQLRNTSRAILFLRIFIGGVILLHVIGKLQTYSNLILEYPSILGLSSATTLSLTILFESLFAALIIIGVATRLISAVMLLVTLLSVGYMLQMEDVTIMNLKLEFLYLDIYITLIISGNGTYGFNVPWLMRREEEE